MPVVVSKYPPGFMRAESQGIMSLLLMPIVFALIVARNNVPTTQQKKKKTNRKN